MRSERIPGMNAIEIHTNEDEMIVITQENFPDDDQTILLNRLGAVELIGILHRLEGAIGGTLTTRNRVGLMEPLLGRSQFSKPGTVDKLIE